MNVDAIFSPAHRLQRILDFEAALARALSAAGIIDAAAADAIAAACDVTSFDLAEIANESLTAGNDVIPTIEQLRVHVARRNARAADYVHWGATSQDAMDTALVLQLREALGAFDHELAALSDALGKLAHEHAATPMVGRTWMQAAAPTTFGFKVTGWLDAVERHRTRLGQLHDSVGVLQFGGAVGNLGALGEVGPRVANALAADLRLRLPAVAWHASRDRFAEVATRLGLLVGTLGKVARDISLMAQSEVGEVREPAAPGRGRSSTMPQKRNPIGCATVLAAATRAPHLAATMLSAMVQEHERGLGGWQAEWSVLPELCVLAFGALHQMTGVVSGLEVDADRMAANLEATRGMVFAEAASFALIPRIGRSRAKAALDRAMRRTADEGTHLRDALSADAEVREHLSSEEIARIFDVRIQSGAAPS